MVEALRAAGHDAAWVPEAGADPGDETILVWAERDRRVLITLDKDFGELVFVQGRLHCGLVRLLDMPVTEQASAAVELVASHAVDLDAGAVIVVERARVRVHRPPATP